MRFPWTKQDALPAPAPAPTPAAATVSRMSRLDGWQNLLNGMGVQGIDKTQSTTYAVRPILTQDQCTNLFRQSWVGRRVVTELVKDSTASGFTVETDDDDDLPAELSREWERLQLQDQCAKGMTWALVYGGAVGVLMTDDELLDPSLQLLSALSPDKVEVLHRMLIVDRRYAIPNLSQITTDPKSRNFGLPETYVVTPFLSGGVLPQYACHWSRLVRFDGAEVDNLTRVGQISWGDSIYESIFDALRQHGSVMQATSVTAAEFSQGVIRMKDLSLNLGSDQNSAIINRLIAFKAMLGTTGIAAVDAELEEYVRLGQPVTGLPELIEKFKDEVCGAIGMPRSRLFGNQAGKVAGAEADANVWAATVHGWQKHTLEPAIRYLLDILCATLGKPGASYRVKFNDIAAPDIDAEVKTRDLHSQTVERYWKMGALEKTEIRKSAFGGTKFSYEITLNDEFTEALEESDERALEAEATPPEPGQPVAPETEPAAPEPQV